MICTFSHWRLFTLKPSFLKNPCKRNVWHGNQAPTEEVDPRSGSGEGSGEWRWMGEEGAQGAGRGMREEEGCRRRGVWKRGLEEGEGRRLDTSSDEAGIWSGGEQDEQEEKNASRSEAERRGRKMWGATRPGN